MITLSEHNTSLSTDPNKWDEPYNNDVTSVDAAERDTEDYLGIFEGNLRLAVGDEKAEEILDQMKNYKEPRDVPKVEEEKR